LEKEEEEKDKDAKPQIVIDTEMHAELLKPVVDQTSPLNSLLDPASLDPVVLDAWEDNIIYDLPNEEMEVAEQVAPSYFRLMTGSSGLRCSATPIWKTING
jgi:hypothetical protein